VALPNNAHAQEIEAGVAARGSALVDEVTHQDEGEQHHLGGAVEVEPEWDRQVVALPEPVGQGWPPRRQQRPEREERGDEWDAAAQQGTPIARPHDRRARFGHRTVVL